jgi:hypothetical protein
MGLGNVKLARRKNFVEHIGTIVDSRWKAKKTVRGRRLLDSEVADKTRQPRSVSTSAILCRTARLNSDPAVSLRDDDERRFLVSVDTFFDRVGCDHQCGLEDRFAGLSLADYSTAYAAALATITADHNSFDFVELCRFLERHYPQIAASSRALLTIGVAAGAQHASHVYFFAEAYRASHDSQKQAQAENAVCVLSACKLGLTIRPKDYRSS